MSLNKSNLNINDEFTERVVNRVLDLEENIKEINQKNIDKEALVGSLLEISSLDRQQVEAIIREEHLHSIKNKKSYKLEENTIVFESIAFKNLQEAEKILAHGSKGSLDYVLAESFRKECIAKMSEGHPIMCNFNDKDFIFRALIRMVYSPTRILLYSKAHRKEAQERLALFDQDKVIHGRIRFYTRFGVGTFVTALVLRFVVGWIMSDKPIIEEAKPALEKIDIQGHTDRGVK